MITILGLLLASPAFSQTEYDDALLAAKRWFSRQEIAALAEPFRGIGTTKGISAVRLSCSRRKALTTILSKLIKITGPSTMRGCPLPNSRTLRSGSYYS